MEEQGNKHPGGRPRFFNSPEELQARIDEYFMECDNRVRTAVDRDGGEHPVKAPKPYTMSGLALALGMSRQCVLNYAEQDEFVDAIACARAKCGAFAEEQLFEGNDRGAKFCLTNNYGFKEQVDVNLSGSLLTGPLSAGLTREQIEDELAQLEAKR